MPLASQIDLPERYRVTRHIASGGMASVWEAEDQLLGRTVAVKMLGSHYAADKGARQRFQREARTAAQISAQPHVVTIYDIGEHNDQAFIVMEYYGGGTVGDRIRAAREALPRETVLRWLREAATALDVAHAAGIVHRDVKPGNLMLDERDRLAVGDFGIARLADDTQMTQTGQVLGTAAYLSPEQALGQPATAASDRYALGVVAYELLTGTRPFTGGPPSAQARQHVEAPPPRASESSPDLPRDLDAVLGRALAKDAAERPPSATAFVDDLERVLEPEAQAQIDPTRPIAAIVPTQPTAKAPPPPRADPPPRRPDPPPQPFGPVPNAEPPQGRPRERRLTPLIALGAAALLIAAVAVIASSGGDPGSATSTTAKTPARERQSAGAETPSSPPPAAAKPSTTTPPSGGGDPAALDAQGYALIKQERYAEAVPLERRAVQGFRDRGDRSSTGYSYALYNLGTALNRSGNPAEAIPYLEERLRISNDRRGIVEQELAAAQQAAGSGGSSGKKDKDRDDE